VDSVGSRGQRRERNIPGEYLQELRKLAPATTNRGSKKDELDHDVNLRKVFDRFLISSFIVDLSLRDHTGSGIGEKLLLSFSG